MTPLTPPIVPGGLAVIIPTLNEARALPSLLRRLDLLTGLDELLLIDGGSTDDTLHIARAWGRARIAEAPRGRASQLNAGARLARAQTLLFLHADTRPPLGAALWIRHALQDPQTLGGAFRTWTLPDRPLAWAPLLHAADLRSRIARAPYGDQALFVRASAFHSLGGFADLPLLEDLDLSNRLLLAGRLAILPASVEVSGRRFTARPLYYALLDNLIPLLHNAGVSPHTLARWYGHVR